MSPPASSFGSPSFFFPFATISNIKTAAITPMHICYAWLNIRVQHPKHMVYPITLLSWLGYLFRFIFYKIISGSIRSHLKLYNFWYSYNSFYPYFFFNLRRDWENDAYQSSSSSWWLPTKEEFRIGNLSHTILHSSHFLVIDVLNIWSYTPDLLTLYEFMDYSIIYT